MRPLPILAALALLSGCASPPHRHQAAEAGAPHRGGPSSWPAESLSDSIGRAIFGPDKRSDWEKAQDDQVLQEAIDRSNRQANDPDRFREIRGR
jgi:outer membrane protein TolC